MDWRVRGFSAAHSYRADIDGLRALAVLGVVVYHFFPGVLPGGFVGVDVFFVISGFLISTVILSGLRSRSFDAVDFYSRRVRRIFPALTAVLVACLVYGWLELPPREFAALGKHAAGGAAFMSNFMLLSEVGYFDTQAELKPLLHLWSLAIEEQFYLLWPLLLWLFWRWWQKILVPIFLVGAVSFVCNVALTNGLSATSFYMPFTRFWELLIGSGLACSALRTSRGGQAPPEQRPNKSSFAKRCATELQAVLGLMLIAASLMLISNGLSFPGWRALFPVVGAALLISSGGQSLVNRFLLANPFMAGIGLISYPIYLWHWPLLSMARIHFGGTVPNDVLWALLLVSLLLSWGTYAFIERPLRFGGRGRLKAAVLVIALMLTGLAGVLVWLNKGYPARYPATIQYAIQDIDFSWNFHVRTEKCHLEGKHFYEHSPECFEDRRPLVAIWGDSHAAALYPGLRTLQESRHFGIIQVCMANCPPIFDLEVLTTYPLCNEMNRSVFKKLVERKPDILVLHAAWQLADYPLTIPELAQKVEHTLRVIKEKLPGTRVIVLGPTPRWRGSPQEEIYRAWLISPDRHAEPPIMQKAAVLPEVEDALRHSSEAAGADYVSLTVELCDNGLCVSRVGEAPTDMLARDYGHLTKASSDYIWKKIEAKVFQQPGS